MKPQSRNVTDCMLGSMPATPNALENRTLHRSQSLSARRTYSFRPALENLELRALPGDLLGAHTLLQIPDLVRAQATSWVARPGRRDSIQVNSAIVETETNVDYVDLPLWEEDESDRQLTPMQPSPSAPLPLGFALGRSNCTRFSYHDFSSTGGLKLNGDAAVVNDQLRVSPAASQKHGSVWTLRQHSVGSGFCTTFRFQITDPGGIAPADGLVFVIQDSGTGALGAKGGGIGYQGIIKSVAVEFDTYKNTWDPNANHLSVHTGGLGPNSANTSYSIGLTSDIPTLADGTTHTARIDYDSHRLAVYLDDLSKPRLAIPLDISTKIGVEDGKAWVGFTSATFSGWENHDILDWTFGSCDA